MPSTFTTNLRLELQATGENDSTWGTILNNRVFQLLEDSITAETSISTSGGTTTLTSSNGQADQSRAVFLDVSGTLTSNATVEIPAANKLYLVRNGTTGPYTVTVTVSGQSGQTVSQGQSAVLYCDGTNTFRIGAESDTAGAYTATSAKTVADTPVTVAVADENKLFLANTTSGAITFNLPAASTSGAGFCVSFMKVSSDTNAVTVDGNVSETINTALTINLFKQYESAFLVSDGSNWHAIRAHAPSAVAEKTSQNTFTKTQTWSKGADVASASALTLGTDGNYFDITGTTTITSIATVGVGTTVKLHFDGALTLTHHATDLILPGAANITTAAGDEAEFVEYASGDWRCTNYSKANGEAVVSRAVAQVVSTKDGALDSGSTVMVIDDTPPLNTEGDEYITLAITPTNASSTLIIETVVRLSHSTSSGQFVSALYQDSTANALSAGSMENTSAGAMHQIVLRHTMTAGTTSSTTFKVRAGCTVAGTTYFNGSSGTRIFGGVSNSSIVITEVLP